MSDLPDSIRKYLDNILVKNDKSVRVTSKRPQMSVAEILSEEELGRLKQLPSTYAAEEKDLYVLDDRQIPRWLQYDVSEFLLSKRYQTDNTVTGRFFYPANGFMSWHTNQNRSDYRIYIVKSLTGDSFFRYEHDGEVVTDYDPIGYSYRIFRIGDDSCPFWHCVFGGSGRYSIGFKITPLST